MAPAIVWKLCVALYTNGCGEACLLCLLPGAADAGDEELVVPKVTNRKGEVVLATMGGFWSAEMT